MTTPYPLEGSLGGTLLYTRFNPNLSLNTQGYVTKQYLIDNYYTRTSIDTMLAAKLSIDGSIAMTGTLSSKSLIPVTTNLYDLGSSAVTYRNGYFNTLYANSEVITQYETQVTSLIEENTGATSTANTGLVFDVSTGLATDTVTNISLAANVLSVTCAGNNTFAVGNSIALTTLSASTASDLNNTSFLIAGRSGNPTTYTCSYTHSNITSVASTGNATRVIFSILASDKTSGNLKYVTGANTKPTGSTVLPVSNGSAQFSSMLCDTLDTQAANLMQCGTTNATGFNYVKDVVLNAASGTNTPLTIKGFAGQTNPMLHCQNSASTSLMDVDALGTVNATGFDGISAAVVQMGVTNATSFNFVKNITLATTNIGTVPIKITVPTGQAQHCFAIATTTPLAFPWYIDSGGMQWTNQTINNEKTTNQLALGTGSAVTTISSVAPAANRTYTIQDALGNDTFTMNAATQTLTNKTYNTAGTGNVFQINGTGITAVTGSGSVVLATSPSLVTPSNSGTVVNQTMTVNSGTVNTTVTSASISAPIMYGAFKEVVFDTLCLNNAGGATTGWTTSTTTATGGSGLSPFYTVEVNTSAQNNYLQFATPNSLSVGVYRMTYCFMQAGNSGIITLSYDMNGSGSFTTIRSAFDTLRIFGVDTFIPMEEYFTVSTAGVVRFRWNPATKNGGSAGYNVIIGGALRIQQLS